MDYQSLHIKTVVELRQLARQQGVKVPAGTNKQTLIQLLLEAERAAAPKPEPEPAPKAEKAVEKAEKPEPEPKSASKAEKAVEKAEKPAEKPARRGPGRPRTRQSEPQPNAKAPDDPQTKPGKPDEKPAAPAEKAAVKPTALPEPPAKAAENTIEPTAKPVEKPVSQSAETPAPKVEQAPAQEAPRPFVRGRGPMSQPVIYRPANPANEGGPRAYQNRVPTRPMPPRPDQPRQEYRAPADYRTTSAAAGELLAAGDCGEGAGVLEIQPDGYGFLRAENCLPGPNDVYISIAQIRRFNLRNGDLVSGKTRPQREGDRYSAMLYISEINGESPDKAAERPRFEDLVPIYPDQRLRLEPREGKGDLSLRLVDMLAPIGKGQRGMIVSQPKAGKTTLLKKLANAITSQYPDVHLIVLLIDERPEEVTDMQRSIQGEVIYSTFDEEPEHHTRVSEMVLARAQRLVEMGKDVVVLMDSITRLARAYNLTITPTGRSLSGGLDPGALFKPKRFFGAARNIENGGSLTIIATALVDTGSRMDDIIFEEFKGTGNMELHLDRKLSDRRVFPAIDLLKSGTRREELLLTEEEMNGEYQVRKMLAGRQQEMYEQLIELMTKTSDNADFFTRLKGWLAVYEKDGYSLGR